MSLVCGTIGNTLQNYDIIAGVKLVPGGWVSRYTRQLAAPLQCVALSLCGCALRVCRCARTARCVPSCGTLRRTRVPHPHPHPSRQRHIGLDVCVCLLVSDDVAALKAEAIKAMCTAMVTSIWTHDLHPPYVRTLPRVWCVWCVWCWYVRVLQDGKVYEFVGTTQTTPHERYLNGSLSKI